MNHHDSHGRCGTEGEQVMWSNSSKLGASAFTPSRSLDSTNQTAVSASYAAFTRMRPLRISLSAK